MLLALLATAIVVFFVLSTGLVVAHVLDDWFWGPFAVDTLLYNREQRSMGLVPRMLLNALLLRFAVRFILSLDRTSYGINRLGLFFLVDALQYLIYTINAILGVAIRLLLGLLGQALALGRLDHSLLSGSLRKYDAFHSLYLAYLHVELYHTHPVFLTALYFLLSRPRAASFVAYDDVANTDEEAVLLTADELESSAGGPSMSARVVRNRWLLAVTLINNPELQKQRKHALPDLKPDSMTEVTEGPEHASLSHSVHAGTDYVLFSDTGKDGAATAV